MKINAERMKNKSKKKKLILISGRYCVVFLSIINQLRVRTFDVIKSIRQ